MLSRVAFIFIEAELANIYLRTGVGWLDSISLLKCQKRESIQLAKDISDKEW
jgi:hypothetical protein